jgi:hypothetical protein
MKPEPQQSHTKGRLMTQYDIQEEYGLPTRDVLRAVASNRGFPQPVRVLGRKRWFNRADIARYFKTQKAD